MGLAVLACCVPAHAQQGSLDGVWVADFVTRLERPKDIKDLVVPPEKAAEVTKKLTRKPKGVYDPDIDWFPPNALLKVKGELRSSWLVEPADGKMPLTKLAEKAWAEDEKRSEFSFANPEERPGSERCISGLGHPPLHAVSVVIPSQFVETPDAILVVTEDTDAGRIIHLAGAAPPQAVRSRAGWSFGRWEGDTLVVETTHLAASKPAGVLSRDEVLVGEGSRVIERFHRVAEDELNYQFTVLDPALYAKPWLAEITLRPVKDKVYEYACHEGNQGMVNILKAARVGRQSKPKPKAKAK